MTWTQRTAALAIAGAIRQRIEGQREALLLVCEPDEVESRLQSEWGVMPRAFHKSLVVQLPASRSVVDLSALIAQDLGIPHDMWRDFLRHNVQKGPHNKWR